MPTMLRHPTTPLIAALLCILASVSQAHSSVTLLKVTDLYMLTLQSLLRILFSSLYLKIVIYKIFFYTSTSTYFFFVSNRSLVFVLKVMYNQPCLISHTLILHSSVTVNPLYLTRYQSMRPLSSGSVICLPSLKE